MSSKTQQVSGTRTHTHTHTHTVCLWHLIQQTIKDISMSYSKQAACFIALQVFWFHHQTSWPAALCLSCDDVRDNITSFGWVCRVRNNTLFTIYILIDYISECFWLAFVNAHNSCYTQIHVSVNTDSIFTLCQRKHSIAFYLHWWRPKPQVQITLRGVPKKGKGQGHNEYFLRNYFL